MSAETSIVQILLNEGGAELKVDGIKGSRTTNALYTNETVLRLVPKIKTMLRAVHTAKASSKWVPAKALNGYVTTAAQLTGLLPSTLMFVINFEAGKRISNGSLQYDASAISKTGIHRGIGQLYINAWTDAEEYRVANKLGITLGSFEENWDDPERSVFAMALYLKASEGFAKIIEPRLKMTNEVRYAIYNQGAGFVRKTIDGHKVTLGKQSSEAIRIAAVARRDILASNIPVKRKQALQEKQFAADEKVIAVSPPDKRRSQQLADQSSPLISV